MANVSGGKMIKVDCVHCDRYGNCNHCLRYEHIAPVCIERNGTQKCDIASRRTKPRPVPPKQNE